MSRIFWDTNLFIYLIEDRGSFTERTVRLAKRMEERNDQLFTSALTLGEIMVHPLSAGNVQLAERYAAIVTSRAVVISFDEQAARSYAAIRREKSVKAPDAIQLACAAKAGMDLFVTNDDRLMTKNVAGIKFIVPIERAFI